MGFKGIVFLTILLVAGGSMAARATLEEDGGGKGLPKATSGGGGASDSFFGGSDGGKGDGGFLPSFTDDGDEGAGAPEAIEDLLPYITEASFFAILGFALGYFSKKVVKLLLLLIAMVFLVIQSLAWLEIVQVDWNQAVVVTNDLVTNFKKDQPITEFLTHRIPAAAGLLGGYFLGFRKG